MRCIHDAGMAGVGEGIRQLHLGGPGDAAVRGRDRRGALRYVGPDTRPSHVTDKRGHIHIQTFSGIFAVDCL